MCVVACYGIARYRGVWFGRFRSVGFGEARWGVVRNGLDASAGLAWVWHSAVPFGKIWYGRYGMVWQGELRSGEVG